jgi:hypothetical protein
MTGDLLPWEDDSYLRLQKRKMGPFRDLVLELLRRDQASRPTMHEFCQRCSRVFASTTQVCE